MVKLSVLYGPPQDPDAFARHYRDNHVPLAQRIPHVQRFEHGHARPGFDGGQPPYHYIAELWFDSPETLQAAFSSDEGQAAVGDVESFATGGATMLVSEVT